MALLKPSPEQQRTPLRVVVVWQVVLLGMAWMVQAAVSVLVLVLVLVLVICLHAVAVAVVLVVALATIAAESRMVR